MSEIESHLMSEPTREQPTEGMAAESFDLWSYFDVEADDDQNKDTPEGGEPGVQNLKSVLTSNAAQTQHRFQQRVTVASLERGANMVGGLVHLFGQLAAACGPLCLHTVSSLGTAVSGGSASAAMGGALSSTKGLSFDGQGNVSFSGSLSDLSRQTGYSADAIRSGQVSSSDLLAALVHCLGSSVSTVMGFGLIEVLISGMIPGGEASAQRAA